MNTINGQLHVWYELFSVVIQADKIDIGHIYLKLSMKSEQKDKCKEKWMEGKRTRRGNSISAWDSWKSASERKKPVTFDNSLVLFLVICCF